MAVAPIAADPITWKSNNPVWVEQWPLNSEKITGSKKFNSRTIRVGTH